MKNIATSVRRLDSVAATTDAAVDGPVAAVTSEQLTLLDVPVDSRARRPTTTTPPLRSVPARFQLSRQTREIGLQHVGEIRRQLAEAKAVRESENVRRLPSRRGSATTDAA